MFYIDFEIMIVYKYYKRDIKKYLISYFFSLIYLLSNVVADIRSSTGNIFFDVNNDSKYEAVVNSLGLGVGTVSPQAKLHILGNGIINGDMLIGSASGGKSSLEINGTLGFGIESLSSNATLSNNSVVFVDTSSENITLTLPYAGNVAGRLYKIKKKSALNKLHVLGGGNHIDNYGHLLEMAYDGTTLSYVNLVSNGINWYILNSSSEVNSIGGANLVGWWKLDETDNNIAPDTSGENNDGTKTNFSSSSDGWVSGKVDNALDFDGTDDYLDIGSNSKLDIVGPITVSLWVKLTSNKDHNVLSKYTAGTSGYGVYIDPSRKFYARHDGLASDATASTNTLNLNTFYHLAYTYDGTTLVMYIDNQIETSVPLAGGIVLNANSLKIGRFTTAGVNYVSGVLDDIRIFNTALNRDQIGYLFNAGDY